MRPKKNEQMFYCFILFIFYIMMCVITLQAKVLADKDITMRFIEMYSESFSKVLSGDIEIYIVPGAIKTIAILTGGFLFSLFWISVEGERNKQTAKGIESGSSKWNVDYDKYNKKYSDPPKSKSNNGPNNIILTKDIFLNMDTRQTKRNNNVLVVGGSGSGKSRFKIKPNLLQANCSFVVTDPAGELLESTGSFLREQGYKIKLFNLVDMKHSNSYNPFNYIRDDVGVLMLVRCLIDNTTSPQSKGGDQFWEKSEMALLQSLIFYLIKYRPKEEQNFTTLMKLLRLAEVDENNAGAQSELDKLFEAVERKDPNSIAVKQYATFKMGTGKTLKSILISCGVRLTAFNLIDIENLTRIDNMELETIGDEKTALFVIIPDADSTYNFIVSMMYSQLFETLYYHAKTDCKGGRLPFHVRFLLDEFANIGQIPDFTKKLSTMRKYEISCTIVLQSLAQIKTMYRDDWSGIIGNCDSFLLLGTSETETAEYVSKLLGKSTIIVRNTGRSRGRSGSSSLNFSKTGRELMTPDEITKLTDSECILVIRGLDPFIGEKFDYTKHKNYPFTGDANFEKVFDYRKEFNNTISVEINETTKEDDLSADKEVEIKENDKEINISDSRIADESLLRVAGVDNVNELENQFLDLRPRGKVEIVESDIGQEEWLM